jgi:hypothetical protein
MRVEKQLSTKYTNITNKYKHKPVSPAGKFLNESGSSLYFVPFVHFVDLFRFLE